MVGNVSCVCLLRVGSVCVAIIVSEVIIDCMIGNVGKVRL